RALLDGVLPGKEPIDLSIGEPQARVPDFVPEIIARHSDDWGKYPPLRGTSIFNQALLEWLGRRYDLAQDKLDSGGAALPLSGTREGLFLAACHAVAARRREGVASPIVAYPNPFYHVYHAGAVANGAQACTYHPDHCVAGALCQIAEAHPGQMALAYVCTPGNPTGRVLDSDRIARLAQLAKAHDFIIVFDECYSEIYRDRPPPGSLELLHGCDQLDQVWVINSLSKRSGVPGLRCGFVYGPKSDMDAFARLRSHAGAVPSMVIQNAAAALWRDELHVIEARAHYQALFADADHWLGFYPGYRPVQAGFFLWLNVEDGEQAARVLWRDYGLRVLPGAYMASALDCGQVPGQAFIRIALVHDRPKTQQALERLAAFLVRGGFNCPGALAS
ncbi:MAG: aminotransferase class I/II-fold pyridoxal phosphate-dependent enzyme, partial [Pseudomonadota bacterium]